tara:strand:- start:65 stop:601 length:537 start_codon:yes stop_codon:yes gene_type:complete
MTSIIKVNTIQDAGGNALLTSNGSGTLTTNNIGESNKPYMRAYMSGSPSIAADTVTVIPYNVSDYNVGGGTYDTSNYRYTPGVAGTYLIIAVSKLKYAVSAGQRMEMRVHKNGTQIMHWSNRAGGDLTSTTSAFFVGTTQLNSTDYIDMRGYNSSGATRSYDTGTEVAFFEVILIAKT